MIVLYIILGVLVLLLTVFILITRHNFKTIVKKFEDHSMSVTGMKGTGKDLIFGNVISRRKKAYISNMDYGGKYNFLDYKKLDCGGNTYEK